MSGKLVKCAVRELDNNEIKSIYKESKLKHKPISITEMLNAVKVNAQFTDNTHGDLESGGRDYELFFGRCRVSKNSVQNANACRSKAKELRRRQFLETLGIKGARGVKAEIIIEDMSLFQQLDQRFTSYS